MNYIIEKWTANGSDIEMLYFFIFLLVCILFIGYMSHRSNKQAMKIQHEIEMHRIKTLGTPRRRGK